MHGAPVDEQRVDVLRQGGRTSEDELKLHVRNTLAHFKTPQWISFVEELPKGLRPSRTYTDRSTHHR